MLSPYLLKCKDEITTVTDWSIYKWCLLENNVDFWNRSGILQGYFQQYSASRRNRNVGFNHRADFPCNEQIGWYVWSHHLFTYTKIVVRIHDIKNKLNVCNWLLKNIENNALLKHLKDVSI